MRAAVAVVQIIGVGLLLRFQVELAAGATERFLLLPQQQGKQILVVVAGAVVLVGVTAYQAAPVS
jgi:hypothetical protein